MTALKKHEDNIVQFSKGKKMADKFEKGYVMSSRLYRYEVRPFLSDAAKNVYAELEDRINGFKDKITDHVSYSQLQGGKLEGSKKLSAMTVRKGLKELLDLGVITLVSENSRKGNEYQINEVSLVDHYKKCSTTTENVALQNMECSTTESVVLGTTKTVDTIELTYRTLSIELLIKSLRSKKPLETHFYCFQEKKKQDQLELEKQEAEAKAKAEAERKDKARKLSYDEVIKLTSERFSLFCDFSLWEQYVSNRSQTAKTKLTKNALNAIYKDFQKWGFDDSNESLKTSITGNYQGLFAPKQQFTPGQQNKPSRWDEIQQLIAQEEQGNDSYGF
ncbi:hypothetical protein [Acinetobacter radioresistens]|uniref:hypothetical protein n=1 Tax=Acinetobacter radioresistens TaxID=40216 RepID=UPI0021CD4CB7|nr:hypothetical protein [Acinetobacter radioresistens]MCU4568485.1 hypothetical protein [Acinetobacter radioresistens]